VPALPLSDAQAAQMLAVVIRAETEFRHLDGIHVPGWLIELVQRHQWQITLDMNPPSGGPILKVVRVGEP
jgi:hypothetical protein